MNLKIGRESKKWYKRNLNIQSGRPLNGISTFRDINWWYEELGFAFGKGFDTLIFLLM